MKKDNELLAEAYDSIRTSEQKCRLNEKELPSADLIMKAESEGLESIAQELADAIVVNNLERILITFKDIKRRFPAADFIKLLHNPLLHTPEVKAKIEKLSQILATRYN